jgi:hypothetical protein
MTDKFPHVPTDKYILDGHEPVPCYDLMEWGRWFEKVGADRIVAKTMVGEVRVSTVFLGLDHNWDDGPPLLFETMVFGGKYDNDMWRYSTWAQAEEGHAKAVALVELSCG